jgi:hypothetical protein
MLVAETAQLRAVLTHPLFQARSKIKYFLFFLKNIKKLLRSVAILLVQLAPRYLRTLSHPLSTPTRMRSPISTIHDHLENSIKLSKVNN